MSRIPLQRAGAPAPTVWRRTSPLRRLPLLIAAALAGPGAGAVLAEPPAARHASAGALAQADQPGHPVAGTNLGLFDPVLAHRLNELIAEMNAAIVICNLQAFQRARAQIYNEVGKWDTENRAREADVPPNLRGPNSYYRRDKATVELIYRQLPRYPNPCPPQTTVPTPPTPAGATPGPGAPTPPATEPPPTTPEPPESLRGGPFQKLLNEARAAVEKACTDPKAAADAKRKLQLIERNAEGLDKFQATPLGAATKAGDQAKALREYKAELEKKLESCNPPTGTTPDRPPPGTTPDKPAGEDKRTSMAPGSFDPFAMQTFAALVSTAFYAEIAFGAGFNRFGQDGPAYESTGGQTPFSLTGRGRTAASLCGELALWYALLMTVDPRTTAAFALGNPHFGAALLLCGNLATRLTLFDEAKHGPGTVRYVLNEYLTFAILFQARIVLWLHLDRLFGRDLALRPRQYAARGDLAQAGAAARGTMWPVLITVGLGPSFTRSRVTYTSDQSFFGGGIPSTSDTRWDTGVTFRIGAQTALCSACAFGQPLMIGVDGTFTWLPSRSLSLTSPAFGFTETARLGSRVNSSVVFKLSVPFGLGRF
jgi:hypothetical protein